MEKPYDLEDLAMRDDAFNLLKDRKAETTKQLRAMFSIDQEKLINDGISGMSMLLTRARESEDLVVAEEEKLDKLRATREHLFSDFRILRKLREDLETKILTQTRL